MLQMDLFELLKFSRFQERLATLLDATLIHFGVAILGENVYIIIMAMVPKSDIDMTTRFQPCINKH